MMMKNLASCFDHQSSKTQSSHMIVPYCIFILGAGSVWHLVADGQFSAVLTLSVMLQCLAVGLLSLQVMFANSAAGISARALFLDALAICCRLSSTLWLNGYLPVDASGDHVFQVIDICSLVMLIWLLRTVLVTKRHTYQAEEDTFPLLPVICGAFVLAALLHGNMNGRPVFDALWMACLFISTVAVLPQMWLITKTGGRVEALTSHFIAAMAASRVLSGLFMWHARNDLTCVPWVTGFNHAIWAILGSHFLHLILLGDFAYYYIKAIVAHGLNCHLELLESCGV
jgi:hypothetical protein